MRGPNSVQEIHDVWLKAVQKRKKQTNEQITQPFKLVTKLSLSPARLSHFQRVKPLCDAPQILGGW